MKNVILLTSFLGLIHLGFSQNSEFRIKNKEALTGKPSLDTSVFTKWWWVDDNPKITNDGGYISYHLWSRGGGDSTVINSRSAGWEKGFTNCKHLAFTRDSKEVFFMLGDTLCRMPLGKSGVSKITHVLSFGLFGLGEYLVYGSSDREKSLVVSNLGTGREEVFKSVERYALSPNGRSMLIYQTKGDSANVVGSLFWIDVENGIKRLVETGKKVGQIMFDDKGDCVAYNVSSGVNRTASAYYFYKQGASEPIMLCDSVPAEVCDKCVLGRILYFSKKVNKLFVELTEVLPVGRRKGGASVNIWTYKDAILQPEQLRRLQPRTYLAALDVPSHRLTRLQRDDDKILAIDTTGEGDADYLYLVQRKGERDDYYWSDSAKAHPFLVECNNGKRLELSVDLEQDMRFTPDGRYLIGVDEGWRNFYSYDVVTGIMRNLTSSLPIPIIPMINRNFELQDRPENKDSRGFWFAAWLEGGQRFLMYDGYDIWVIDPANKVHPWDITKGYGRRHRLSFRLCDFNEGKSVNGSKDLVLAAFDNNNEQAGFFLLGRNWSSRASGGHPLMLSMGPYRYGSNNNGVSQIQASDTALYIIKRESERQAPNYFWTYDFKTFLPVSDVAPQDRYEWLYTELIRFKTIDGRTEKAVLYKPDDFDSVKRYPVIVHYYERMSEDLHKFQMPEATFGQLDIAWFVSHGYVVCTPDVHYRTGAPGLGVFNSVEGVGRWLVQLSWVDARRLGLQGHSFGGYETNYTVTHTDRYAAAVSSCGIADLISESNTTLRDGNQAFYEMGEIRLGATLWQKPEVYIENSPILRANKVTTPLLLVDNELDRNVSFAQGVEWFLALRRLKKPVWMLQYDGEHHGESRPSNYADYIIRSTQFFDHFLKGKPVPKWMAEGIPARLKGIDDGLEMEYGRGESK